MEKIKIEGLDEEIFYTKTKDGLEVYIWPNMYAKSFYLSLNVKYGSIHTDFKINNKVYNVPQGIAHFMEHLKFNVDEDTTANDLFDPLGSDINAFTTFKYTSYIVYGVTDIITNLNYLLDYVLNPYFTKELIQKEKGIVISEINMGEDQVYNKLFFEFNKSIYQKDKFRDLITGTSKDVKSITLKDLNLVYNTFYHPQNMFLVVTGNVNPYEIEDTINKNLAKKEIPKFRNFELLKIKEPKQVNEKYKTIRMPLEVEKAKIGLKLERKNFKDIPKEKLNIIFSIILEANFGEASDLKEELLMDGLISFMTSYFNIEDDYIVLDITIESKLIEEAIKRITKALEHLKVLEEDVKRLVNSSIANLVLSYEDVEQVNHLIQDNIINYNSLLNKIKGTYESITYNDVNDVLKKINSKELAIVKIQNE